MTRWLVPATLAMMLGCTGLVGADGPPAGDTADPDHGGPVAEAPADAPDDNDGAADAEADEPVADDEPDAPVAEEEGDPVPAARRPRRRKRGAPPPTRRSNGAPNPSAEPAPTPEPAPAQPEPAPEPAPKKAKTPSPKPKGITQLSDTHWQVTKANFERWKGDPYALGGGISQSGDGWEVRWVRKREAWHLGMKNKDVVLEINGKKLKNKAQLAAAYLALKNKSDFEVLFERKGQRMTHQYTVK
mgnify:CR=1 FL=1